MGKVLGEIGTRKVLKLIKEVPEKCQRKAKVLFLGALTYSPSGKSFDVDGDYAILAQAENCSGYKNTVRTFIVRFTGTSYDAASQRLIPFVVDVACQSNVYCMDCGASAIYPNKIHILKDGEKTNAHFIVQASNYLNINVYAISSWTTIQKIELL